MFKSLIVPGCVLVLVLNFGCSRPKPVSEEARLRFEGVIPKPMSSAAGNEAFQLTSDVGVMAKDDALSGVAEILAGMLRSASGFEVPVSGANDRAAESVIELALNHDPELGREGYVLSIEEGRIAITGNTPAGVFFGVQTLRQLLPEAVEADSSAGGESWEIATGTIRDRPLPLQSCLLCASGRAMILFQCASPGHR